MMNWILSMPTWMMIRVIGLSAYGFLFLGTSSGVLHSMPGWTAVTKRRMYNFHSWSNGIGLGLAILHTLLLIIDTYAPFQWTEVLVPFAAPKHPILNGLGTLALYGSLIVLFTTDLRNRINRRTWHLIHMLAYPIFIAALVHGIGVGTDTKEPLISAMYWATGAAVVLLTVVRVAAHEKRPDTRSNGQPQHARQPV